MGRTYLFCHFAKLLPSSDPDSTGNASTSPDKYSHFLCSIMTAKDGRFIHPSHMTFSHLASVALDLGDSGREAGPHLGWDIRLSQGSMHTRIHTLRAM